MTWAVPPWIKGIAVHITPFPLSTLHGTPALSILELFSPKTAGHLFTYLVNECSVDDNLYPLRSTMWGRVFADVIMTKTSTLL